jgi:hypothetical protein
MTTAEKIFSKVQALPEREAREVLELVDRLEARRQEGQAERRAAAIRTLAKYRGRFDPEKFDREELHGRHSIR